MSPNLHLAQSPCIEPFHKKKAFAATQPVSPHRQGLLRTFGKAAHEQTLSRAITQPQGGSASLPLSMPVWQCWESFSKSSTHHQLRSLCPSLPSRSCAFDVSENPGQDDMNPQGTWNPRAARPSGKDRDFPLSLTLPSEPTSSLAPGQKSCRPL